MLLGVMAILAGCSTPTNRVNLFEDSDYRMTRAGAVVDGMETKLDGVWFSRPAIERLQREKILP